MKIGKTQFSIGYALNIICLAIVGFVTVYPFIYILSISITPPAKLLDESVFLWPLGFDLDTYKRLLQEGRILLGFKNSIIYTLVGTCLNVIITVMTAYPLASKRFEKYSKPIMKMIIFTMYFSGGMIPSYLLIRSLGMMNTIWSMVIPSLIYPFYLILTIVFIKSLPVDLLEAAKIDGAQEAMILFKIVVPLCMPIIACITLYYSVGIWNSFFNALLYLNDAKKYPLQVYIREIVLSSQMSSLEIRGQMASGAKEIKFASEAVKSATLVISAIPILVCYPFLQKYFTKGILLGSVKG